MNTVLFPLKREHSKFTNQRDIDNIIAAKKKDDKMTRKGQRISIHFI